MTMKTTRGLNETTDKLVLIAEKQRVGTPGVKSTFIDADIHSMLMQIKGGHRHTDYTAAARNGIVLR